MAACDKRLVEDRWAWKVAAVALAVVGTVAGFAVEWWPRRRAPQTLVELVDMAVQAEREQKRRG